MQATIASSARRSREGAVEHQLQLARTLAGRPVVRVDDVTPQAIVDSLGDLVEAPPRPGNVALDVADASALPTMCTDAAKLTDVLRTLTTSALRHSDCGEVRVGGRLTDDRQAVIFTVGEAECDEPDTNGNRIPGPVGQLGDIGGGSLGLERARQMIELLGGSLVLRPAQAATGAAWAATVPLPARRSASDEPRSPTGRPPGPGRLPASGR